MKVMNHSLYRIKGVAPKPSADFSMGSSVGFSLAETFSLNNKPMHFRAWCLCNTLIYLELKESG
jgi:hypothetical protein